MQDRAIRRVPILCYHRVHADADPTAPAVVPGQYCGHVTVSRFAAQMDILAAAGFQVVTHYELMKWLSAGGDLPAGKLAAIDFDDNRRNVFDNAFPILQQHGFRATVFVISELAAGRLPGMADKYPAMGWVELRRLRDAGWTMGAHTETHQPLVELYADGAGAAAVERELAASRRCLERELGVLFPNFAYPTGSWNPDVERLVQRHYSTARHWQGAGSPAYNTAETDPFRLQAINISMLTEPDAFRAVLDDAR